MANMQDILSQIKSALTSDTAKGIGKGLAVTAGSALLGGAGGVAGVSSAIDQYRSRQKQRDLDRLSDIKNKLNTEILQEELKSKQMKNREIAGQIGAEKIADRLSGNIKPVGRSAKEKTSLKPTKFSEVPLRSTSEEFVSDPEELQKNIEKARQTGSKDVTELARKIKGIGPEAFKATDPETGIPIRRSMAQELRAKNLNPFQEQGAWQELSESAMPGQREKARQMIAENEGVTPFSVDPIATLNPGDAARKSLLGAGIGTMAGLPFGPVGATLMGSIGAAAGPALYEGVEKYFSRPDITAGEVSESAKSGGISRAFSQPAPAEPSVVHSAVSQEWPRLSEEMASYSISQSDAQPTPAIAGTENVEGGGLTYEAKRIVDGILSVARPGEYLSVIDQLQSLPDFISLGAGEKAAVLAEIEKAIGPANL